MVDQTTIDPYDIKIKENIYQFRNDIIMEYSKWLYSNDYALNTSKAYCYIMRKVLGKELQLSIGKIKNYLNKIENKTTQKYASIRCFIGFLDDKYNMLFPYFKYPRFKKEIKVKKPAPTIKEVKLIIEEFKKDKITNFRIYDYTLFIEFMVRSGSRISEIVKIKIPNINWKAWIDNKQEWSEVGIIKTKGNKSRIIPIPPGLMSKVYELVNQTESGIYSKNAFLFDFGFDSYRIKKYKFWKRKKLALIKGEERSEKILLHQYVAKCGNDIERRLKELSLKAIGRVITSHELRAAKITDMDNKGIGISKIRDFVGHTNILTTSGYIRRSHQDMKEVVIEKEDY